MDVQGISVAELVRQDSRWIPVFEKYGIDYCCGGEQSLQEVCLRRDIAIEQILQEFQSIALQLPGSLLHVRYWDVPFVVEFIVRNHHRFTIAVLDEVARLLPVVLEHHREQLPVLVSLDEIVRRIDREFRAHLHREEQLLFPFVRESRFADIPSDVLAILESEHELEAAEFERLRTLTRDFQPPIACAKTQRLYELLRQLYFDLHQHAFLENHVLFPEVKKRIAAQREGNGDENHH